MLDFKSLLLFGFDLAAELLKLGLGGVELSSTHHHRFLFLGLGPLVDFLIFERGIDEASWFHVNRLSIHQLDFVFADHSSLSNSFEDAGGSDRCYIFQVHIVGIKSLLKFIESGGELEILICESHHIIIGRAISGFGSSAELAIINNHAATSSYCTGGPAFFIAETCNS